MCLCLPHAIIQLNPSWNEPFDDNVLDVRLPIKIALHEQVTEALPVIHSKSLRSLPL